MITVEATCGREMEAVVHLPSFIGQPRLSAVVSRARQVLVLVLVLILHQRTVTRLSEVRLLPSRSAS